jgi:hypothetical protein
MPRRLVPSTLVYFGLAEPPRRDNAPLSDTALVIRWVPWLLPRASRDGRLGATPGPD